MSTPETPHIYSPEGPPDVYPKSRAQFHHEDLAPILNYVTCQVYDRATDTFEPPEELSGRNDFVVSDLLYVARMSRFHVYDIAHKSFAESNSAHPLTELTGDNNKFCTKRITYFFAPDTLDEGLTTGMIMPVKAYLFLTFEHPWDLKPTRMLYEYALEEIDPKSAAEMMRRKDFQASLARLSITGNGFYGSESTSLSKGDRLFPDAISVSPYKDGRKICVSEKAKNKLKRVLAKEASGSSDGCPARFATHRVIGSKALEIAAEMGIAEDELRNQGRSAIAAGCEYITACLDKIIAARAEVASSTAGATARPEV